MLAILFLFLFWLVRCVCIEIYSVWYIDSYHADEAILYPERLYTFSIILTGLCMIVKLNSKGCSLYPWVVFVGKSYPSKKCFNHGQSAKHVNSVPGKNIGKSPLPTD